MQVQCNNFEAEYKRKSVYTHTQNHMWKNKADCLEFSSQSFYTLLPIGSVSFIQIISKHHSLTANSYYSILIVIIILNICVLITEQSVL